MIFIELPFNAVDRGFIPEVQFITPEYRSTRHAAKAVTSCIRYAIESHINAGRDYVTQFTSGGSGDEEANVAVMKMRGLDSHLDLTSVNAQGERGRACYPGPSARHDVGEFLRELVRVDQSLSSRSQRHLTGIGNGVSPDADRTEKLHHPVVSE